jgi:hypothetical protein
MGGLSVGASNSGPLRTDQSTEIEQTSVTQPQENETTPTQSESAQKKSETIKPDGAQQKKIEQNIAGSMKQKELNEQLNTDTLQSQPVATKDPFSSARRTVQDLKDLKEEMEAQRMKVKILEEKLEKAPEILKPALQNLIDKEKTKLKKAEDDPLIRKILEGLQKKSEKSPIDALKG